MLSQVWGVEESSSRTEVAQIERSASYTGCFQTLGGVTFQKATFQYEHKMHFKLNININMYMCIYMCVCIYV